MRRSTPDHASSPDSELDNVIAAALHDDALADGPDGPDDFHEHEIGEDAWLDRIHDRPQHKSWKDRLGESFSMPAQWAWRTWSFVSTTPGTMVAGTVFLTLALFAAGSAMSQSSAARQASLDTLVTATEPMSNSTHVLYTSLSQADTVATTSFVDSGVETAEERAAYNAAIDRAVLAANLVLSYAADSEIEAADEVQGLVVEIQRQVPIYTGMIETARTNNRMGNPVGAAYMSDASALMREELLPMASRLFDITRGQVSTEQRRLAFPQLFPLSGLLAAIFFLVLAQVWLARVTHRRLNRGFLAATALMSIAVLWVVVSNVGTWVAGNRGFEQAAQPWDELTTSRIAAQQSRTEETLALVRRTSVEGQTTTSFDETYAAVSQALSNAENDTNTNLIRIARTSLDDWRAAHERLGVAMDHGDYEEAVYVATSEVSPPQEEPTAAQSYQRLDAILSELINDSRESLRNFINDGLAATNLVAASVMVLSLLSIVAIWLGIHPRIQEYM
ncbi:hypothetical protein [Corynebacterium cystitidis]|uniref:Uncharacterized protein n=1 Tax=Corynebacterium cystitidis DSM 20524 TaxID=1121357 RepID=A0A1H9V400_9CORY|nr:hypothetical protein [Corynebacterium cystitidis]WJY83355.1 hypothetical protein CCYS_12340 [Corynebacterium cystitidis DSM 20524]SES16445.1 hypothetical protein SAMN05661109_02058 [Corynebacterium cystitidis DSM 20524]SNV62820.1 hypothetical membrane protein [Corynebacterium cystitidis]